MLTSRSSTVYKKEFKCSSFLVDGPKLSRIINIIMDKSGSEDGEPDFKFQATLQSGKEIQVVSFDALLSLDNSTSDPIVALDIQAIDGSRQTTVEISFGTGYRVRGRNSISLRVRSSNQGIALQLFAELDEQIERTILRDLAPRYLKSSTLWLVGYICILAFMVSGVVRSMAGDNTSVERAKQELARSLVERYSQVDTQEEKVDFLFQYTYGELAAATASRTVDFFPRRLLSFQSAAVMLPILIVVVIVYYLIARCYPKTNFLWGDYEEYYAQLMARRRYLWSLVVGSILLGIVTNMFVIGLSATVGFGQ